MRTQVRLAERQGLLTGNGLSVLQVSAVFYREVEESLDVREERRQGFKYALLATGKIPITDLFPELFTEVVENDNAELEDDEEQVTYKFAEHELTPEEVERELAQLMSGGTMTVNGREVTGGQA